MTQPVSPLANVDQINRNTATPAQHYADRLQTLNSNGHDWMPPDMQATLAAAPTSDSGMIGIADSIKAKMAQTWDGFTAITDDPVLHKKPSTGLALARLLHSSIGPIPVVQNDLVTIQKNLQTQGYGTDLPADGVWDATWNSAYGQYGNVLRSRQYAGDEPGSMSTQHVSHHFWDALIPSHAINSIIGYAKALPGETRNLIADQTAGALAIPHELQEGPKGWARALIHMSPQIGPLEDSLDKNQGGVAAAGGAAVRSIGGRHLTAQQFEQTHGVDELINNVGLVLSLMPIAGRASSAARVVFGDIGGSATRDVAAQEGGLIARSFARDPAAAVRSPGIVARNVFGGLREREIEAAGGEVQSGLRNALSDNAVRGAELRKGPLNALSGSRLVTGSRLLNNIPILSQVGPVVGRLADADGLYYQARTLLATPYQFGAVRAAGSAAQSTFLTGSGINLAAQIDQGITGGDATTDSILHDNTLNYIDRGLAAIAGTPGAQPFTHAVDALGFVLHGPLGDTARTVAAGDKVQAVNDAAAQLQGNINILGHFQRGIHTATDHLPTVDELTQSFGSRERLDRFITMKTFQLAATHAAQRTAQEEHGLVFGDAGYEEATKAAMDAVWNDPQAHLSAVRELLSQDSGQGFANRVAADMLHSNIRDVAGLGRDGNEWMNASDVLTNRIVKGGLASELYGMDGRAVIHAAQAAFDHGADGETRLMTSTRQQYVDDTRHYFGRVQRGVDKARKLTGRVVADAQQAVDDLKAHPDAKSMGDQIRSAQGRLQSAKATQQKIEAAVTSGRLDRLAAAMKKLNGVHGTPAEWAKLANDHKTFKELIAQTAGPEETYNLPGLLETGVNPDALYTRINGEPRPADEAIGSPDWMRSNLQHKSGGIGLAKKDQLLAPDAVQQVQRLIDTASEARTEEEVAASFDAMRDYGFENFGLDAKSLGVFDNADRLGEVLMGHAHRLAMPVFTDLARSPELRAAMKEIDDRGYQIVLGSHIGHMFDGSMPELDSIDGAVGLRRRFVGALGLNPEHMSSKTRGQDARIRIIGSIDREIADDPKAYLGPRNNASTVMAVLQDKNLLQPEMKTLDRVAFAVSRPLHKTNIELLTRQGMSKAEAEEEYRAELSRALQVRDIPRKTAVNVLTTPGKFANGGDWSGVDEHTAHVILRAIQRGYQAQPNYIVGLSGLETWARSGFYIGDRLAHAFPDSGAIQAFANAPNYIVQLRNQLRFRLSPFFDLRRVVKTNAKMSLDGVDPVLNPLKHLVDSGSFDQAHGILARVLGEQADAAGFDNADRYLHQQSIWGLYNSRHYEAYYAHQKHLDGFSDDAIREGIHKVFDYGSIRQGGQSALERTVNTIFFPFSFEKTLIRNTGMYYLDHPQQALLATGIMAAYGHANEHNAITNWVSDHLPFAREVQKFNAFSHGISPGQFGGINATMAPLILGLFMPQQWGKNLTTANLKKNLPIWKDFGQVVSDAYEQSIIGKNAAANALTAMHVLGPANPQDPYRPTITKVAQYRKAGEMRNRIILQATPVLDYNSHQSSALNEISWPDASHGGADLPPQIQGQPVNRTTIGWLVKRWYPAYDPTHAQTYAVQAAADARAFIDKLKVTDPKKATEYGAFASLASQVQGHLQDGDYDTPTAASTIANFRSVAIAASETDPTFYKWYNDHYRFLFGPLEGITKP